MQEWQAAGVEQLRLSTVDLTGVPTLENLHQGVDFALKHREQGSSVYVHCKAGRSRSATLAAAYLIKVSFKTIGASSNTSQSQGLALSFEPVLSCTQLHCWTPEEACEKLASVRPHVLVRSAQMEMLRRYHQQVCSQSG